MRLKTIQTTELGKLYCYDPDSTKYILKEIIDNKSYENKMFHFEENDTVIDVGANIGIFSSYISHKLHDKIRLFAIEPIPDNFEALKKNIHNSHLDDTTTLYNIGLTDFNSPEEIDFTYYPNSSVMSTMDQSIIENGFFKKQSIETAKIFFKKIKSRISRLKYFFNMFVLSLKPLSTFLYKSLIKNYSKNVKVKCRMSNLSQIIAANHIDKIDFLKIDTEGAEWKIINGLKPEDWQKIKQIGMEIHKNDYVKPIIDLLTKNGFTKIELQHDDYLRNEIGVFQKLYAVR